MPNPLRSSESAGPAQAPGARDLMSRRSLLMRTLNLGLAVSVSAVLQSVGPVFAAKSLPANPQTQEASMPTQQSAADKMIGDFAPKFTELTDKLLFGDIWERPELSKRDRSLITVATLVALYRTNELPFHLNRALDNGVSREELVEAITHLAFYAGWPCAFTAMTTAKEVMAKRG